MSERDEAAARTPGVRPDALAAFLGRWRAEGDAYGGPAQSADAPKSASVPWTSTHSGTWHTGEFFLIQDERATVGGMAFDTLSVLGVEADGTRYFVRSFENHGFQRHYALTVDGRVWTLTGDTERARIEFSADGRTQTIAWEWKPRDRWLPLCDRVAHRVD